MCCAASTTVFHLPCLPAAIEEAQLPLAKPAVVGVEKKQAAQSAARVMAGKRDEIDKINLRLQRLLDSFLEAVIDRDEYTAEKTKLMSQKKSMEAQIVTLSTGQADWIDPLQSGYYPLKTRVKSLFRLLFKRRGFLLKKCLARTSFWMGKKPVVLA